MSDCECLPRCPFFNDRMPHMPATATMYKKRYCTGEPDGCARYMVFRQFGSEGVPGDLYPNMVSRAETLLAGR